MVEPQGQRAGLLVALDVGDGEDAGEAANRLGEVRAPGAVLLGDSTLVAWYRCLYAPRHGRGV
jgi:hypothetical protein